MLKGDLFAGQLDINRDRRVVAGPRSFDHDLRHAGAEGDLEGRLERNLAIGVEVRVRARGNGMPRIVSEHGHPTVYRHRSPHTRGKVARGRTALKPVDSGDRGLGGQRFEVGLPRAGDRGRLVRVHRPGRLGFDRRPAPAGAADRQGRPLHSPSLRVAVEEQRKRHVKSLPKGPARPQHGDAGCGERRFRTQREPSVGSPYEEITDRIAAGEGEPVRQTRQPSQRQSAGRTLQPIAPRVRYLHVAGSFIDVERLKRLHDGAGRGPTQGNAQAIKPDRWRAVG